jgi:hypothetical protein
MPRQVIKPRSSLEYFVDPCQVPAEVVAELVSQVADHPPTARSMAGPTTYRLATSPETKPAVNFSTQGMTAFIPAWVPALVSWTVLPVKFIYEKSNIFDPRSLLH